MRLKDDDVLVALSHLRWDWVWQRPQHLISRLGVPGATFVLEEPRPVGRSAGTGPHRIPGDVTRFWLDVPGDERWIGFRDAEHDHHLRLLEDALPTTTGRRIVWMYTALALDLAQSLRPDVLVYDVMDDLASFKDAAPEQQLRHHAALHRADVVFTGGRSLHASAASVRATDIHCFPSGVEVEHFRRATELRALRTDRAARPVAGYVGVLDERIDWDLVAQLADALPSWSFVMVGPVAKVDSHELPVRPNLRYTGPRPYQDLPEVLAAFDVGIMPFALNEATRSISPTKTLEYLAAGLPVVSTPVPDVVADHGAIVRIADSPASFAAACLDTRDSRPSARDVARVVRASHWDSIAARMSAIVDSAGRHVERAAAGG